eukprot:756127-Hanusia_phi.AAC.2
MVFGVLGPYRGGHCTVRPGRYPVTRAGGRGPRPRPGHSGPSPGRLPGVSVIRPGQLSSAACRTCHRFRTPRIIMLESDD